MTGANVRAALKALSSDQAIDWHAAESGTADAGSQAILRELEVIARISAVHRNPDIGSSPPRILTFSRAGETTVAPDLRWGPLLLKGRLGSGADGEVHRAFDERLQREVALKVLRKAHHAPGVARFLNEARLLARVRHTNVVTVHGADVISGQAGIWMELIDGSTLQDLVARQGPLAAHEAALIGAELCRGLAAIHQAGILHRDIKAQNVMREKGGRIVLMDFSVSAADSQRPGLAGTPLYLAPELLQGHPASPQADIYSVGVLLYYLVTGAYPIAGASVPDIARAHQDGRKTRLRDARADLPVAFVGAVDRALSADPALRPASAGELEDVLMQSLPKQTTEREAATAPAPANRLSRKWLLAAAAIAVVALAGATIAKWPLAIGRSTSSPATTASRPWIMVAAFDNRTADRNLDGVLEYALERELINATELRVASRPRVDDALRLMRRPVDTRLDAATAREVALRDGQIRTIIEGRVEQVGGITVLSASLIDVHSGSAITSVSQETGDPSKLPQAMRGLAARVRAALGNKAASDDDARRQLERVTTPSLNALRLYTESYAAGERDNWPAAMSLAARAVEDDPSFAIAHTWLAWTQFRNRLPQTVYLPGAAKAVELSGNTSEWERLWIAASYHSLNGDNDRAVPLYEALVTVYPDHFWAVNNLVGQYQRLGRDAEAVSLALRLVELRPHDYDALYIALDQLQRTGSLHQGQEYARRIRNSGVYDRNPSGDAWVFDAFVAWHDGDAALASRELQEVESEVLSLDRELRDAILRRVSMVWLALGRPTDAARVLALVLPNSESHVVQATVALAVGDLSKAHDEVIAARVGESQGGEPNFADLNRWTMEMWLVAQSGAAADSTALLAAVGPRVRKAASPVAPAILSILAGEEAAGRGAFEETVRAMHDLDWNAVGPRTMFQARETLADALSRSADPAAALEPLQSLAAIKHRAAYDRPFWWMRCRLLQAELYERLGRHSEAQAAAHELDAMLREAEPDFPIAARVRAINTGAR